MQFGVCLPTYAFGVQPSREVIEAVALAAERFGYDSVWASDHILAPRDKPRYGNLYEAITTLTYVAGITRRVRLGTSVLVLPQRDPRLVAKQVATLDALSGGRVILGLGAGWMEDEFKNLGADFQTRGRRMDEAIRVMKVLWTDPDPRFEGKFYRFGGVFCEPRPVQPGGPPLWIGGYSEATLRRTATVGDALHADDMPTDQLAAMAERLQALARAAGRSVAVTLRRTVDMRPAAVEAGRLARPSEAGGIRAGRWSGGTAGALTGSRAEIVEAVAQAAAAGVSHFICQFEHTTQEEHLASIEVFAQSVIPGLAGRAGKSS